MLRLQELGGLGLGLGDMRSGKSTIALCYAVLAGYARILVVCPTTPMGVWKEEAEILGCPWPVVVLNQDSLAARAQALERLIKRKYKGVIVVNYESLITVNRKQRDDQGRLTGVIKQDRLMKLILRWRPELLIGDEIQKIKRRTAAQSRAMLRLASQRFVRSRVGLTGTPITRGNEDLFSIFFWINPTVFGRSWAVFAEHYLEFGGWNGKQVAAYRHVRTARRKIEQNSFTIRQSDLFMVRKPIYVPYPVYLTEASARRYVKLRKEAWAQILGKTPEGDAVQHELVAPLRVTQLGKLHQLAGGHVKVPNDDPDRPPITVDVSSEKLDAAVELAVTAAEEGNKIVWAAYYRREVRRLAQRLEALYPGEVGVMLGGGSAIKREQTKRAFQDGTLRILVVQIKVASLGIKLTAAHIVGVYSTGYSLEDFRQFLARTVGPDQTEPCTYYFLQAQLPNGQPTVDRTIYDALSHRQEIASRMVDLDYCQRLII